MLSETQSSHRCCSTTLFFCGFFLTWAGAILTGTGYGQPELVYKTEYKRMAGWVMIAGPIILSLGILVFMVAATFCLCMRMKNDASPRLIDEDSKPVSQEPYQASSTQPQQSTHFNKDNGPVKQQKQQQQQQQRQQQRRQERKPAFSTPNPAGKYAQSSDPSNRRSQPSVSVIGRTTQI